MTTLRDVKKLLRDPVNSVNPVLVSDKQAKLILAKDVADGVKAEIGWVNKNGLKWTDNYVYWVKDGVFCATVSYPISSDALWIPISISYLMDLTRRSIERRRFLKGDVSEIRQLVSEQSVYLIYDCITGMNTLASAADYVDSIVNELDGPVTAMCAKVEREYREAIKSISPQNEYTTHELLAAVNSAQTSDLKGRSLEELMCRLFQSIRGIEVNKRIKTATEEIDILVEHDGKIPLLRHETPMFLIECKNWSGKVGKDELVLFEKKIINRRGRCSFGVIVSWNGFTKDLKTEYLRSSQGNCLIVFLDGSAIEESVLKENFKDIFLAQYKEAMSV